MTIYKKPLLKKIENLDIDILGYPYKISFVEKLIERFNTTGCASVWGNDIQIDPSVTNLDILGTLLHEAMEVMLRKTETKYDHELVSRLEVLLMMFIIKNPRLMELILETTKKEARSLKSGAEKKAKRMVKVRKRQG